MADPTPPAPYLHFPGTAREALTFYARVFGGSARLHSFEDFNRTDGPAAAIAHGYLADGPVQLFAADATGGQPSLRCEGLMLSLLGAADAPTLRTGSPSSPRAARWWMTSRHGRGARPTARLSIGTACTG